VDETARSRVAGRLLDAYATREGVEPPTASEPGLTLEDAYAVQLLQVDAWRLLGERVVGHKVGLTSAAMQAQLGVDEPDYGHLTDRMVHAADAPIASSLFLQPRIEPEVAFVLGRDLTGPGVTVATAAAAVELVLPALEIIDSRVRDWRITLLDTIADNASSGGIVLGTRAVRVTDVDLELSGCVLRRNGAVVGTGAGAAVLGSPLVALAWLANTLGERGVPLEAGHVVLPGSITAAVPVTAGDTVTATFGGIGSVTASFS
jgi:2-keto-4-pentenoate hydratase